jgi:hypothetical protein
MNSKYLLFICDRIEAIRLDLVEEPGNARNWEKVLKLREGIKKLRDAFGVP